MPPPPPLDEVAKAYQTLVLPAAGVAALAAVLVLAAGRRLAYLAGVAGVLAGVAFADWGAQSLPFRPGSAVVEWVLPAAGLAAAVGLVTHYLALLTASPAAVAAVWAVRSAGLIVAGRWLVPNADPAPPGFAPYLLAAVSLAEWAVLDAVAGRPPAGRSNRGAQVVGSLGVATGLAGGVAIYAHSAKLMDAATMTSAALTAVAVVATATGTTCRGAIPGGVMLLTGAMFVTRYTSDSAVPAAAFWLAAASPLALAVWLVPAVGRRDGWAGLAARYAAPAAVVGVGLVLAGRVETLPWEDTPDAPAADTAAPE